MLKRVVNVRQLKGEARTMALELDVKAYNSELARLCK